MLQYIQDNIIFFIIILACVITCVAVLYLLSTNTKAAEKDNAEHSGLQTGTKEQIPSPVEAKEQPIQSKAADSNAFEPESFPPVPAPDADPVSEPLPKNREEAQPIEKFRPANPTAPVRQPAPVPPAYRGKWVITCVDTLDEAMNIVEQAFFFQLKASNGEPLLSSEDYTTIQGATAAIDAFKRNIEAGNFKISTTKKGTHVVKLLNGQGMLLAQGEPYSSLTAATNAIASIQRFANTAVLSDEIQRFAVPFEPEYYPTEQQYSSTRRGKWTLRSVTNSIGKSSFFFELRASNGQILFTSEDYTSLNGAKDGIVTHRNNILNGNIRACVTRKGDYILKIYTSDGRLLALGDHYATKTLCCNAISSVMRFAYTADIDQLSVYESSQD